MLRTRGYALIVACMFLVLFGVAGGQSVELQWYGPPGPLMADIAQEIADDYRQLNPNVSVQVGGRSTQQAPDAFITQIVGGVIPDLVFIQFSDIAWWAAQGFLMPIDRLAQEAGFYHEEFVPGAWESMSYEGKLYALPLVIEPFALLWSVRALEAAGIDPTRAPATWAELEEHARTMVRVNGDVTTHFGAQFAIDGIDSTSATALTLAAQLDAPVIRDGRTHLDDQRWQRALETIIDTELKQGGQPGWASFRSQFAGQAFGDVINGWAQGRLGYAYRGPWMINQLYNVDPQARLGVGPMPVLDGGRQVVTAKGWSVAIPANAQHPEEAIRFLRYLMSVGPLEKWYRYQSSLPAHMESLRHVMVEAIHELNSPEERLAFADLATKVNVAAPPPSPIAMPLVQELNQAVIRARAGENPAQVLSDINTMLTVALQEFVDQ